MTTRSNSTKRGASRAKSAGKSSGRSLPGWVWLIAGLVIGVFVAFLAGLTPSAKDVRTVAGKTDSVQEKGTQNEHQPVFDFYTLLPESEVSVSSVKPEPIRKSIEEELGVTPRVAPNPAQESAQKPSQPAIPAEPQKYLLQAGSFRNQSDADRLRAKLLLDGVLPKVVRVNVGNGETWHRVQIGPFSDRSELKNAQNALANHNIEGLLMKLK